MDLWPTVAIYDPDCAFICTPTDTHIAYAYNCAELGIPFLLEKPVSDTRIPGWVLERVERVSTYVAYPLRFLPFKPVAHEMRFVCCSDASKWPSSRPIDHVLLELSHELDLAEYWLGEITEIKGDVSRFRAELEISHKGGNISSHYLSISSLEECRYVIADQRYDIVVSDDIYIKQLLYFFDNLGKRMMNSMSDAAGLIHKILEVV